ncbi:MmcQ/YjbR family DNA-binding protein [Alphaproteobacteria bacterium KMM 3653]|uniref:MmcQ/YjbR family DNA-binding protein n=1 Tax=Harenicola maris TaxID=2841044 RepID=A0AAP2G7Z3_9RHOB|nr:MmcQ/YjbR family DNA-binding protein [Harenicola maris]
MSRDTVNALCKALPGAEWSSPFGPDHDTWKVGGKIFAQIGAVTPGVILKTPDTETAQLLIEVGAATKAPYFHGSWALFDWDKTEAQDMEARIAQSYDLIRASLTKKVQASLAPR